MERDRLEPRPVGLIRLGGDAAIGGILFGVLVPWGKQALEIWRPESVPAMPYWLPIVVGFACFAVAGVSLVGGSTGRTGHACFVGVAAVASLAAVAVPSPLATLAYLGGLVLVVHLLAIGLSITPTTIAGQRPRTWWRIALGALVVLDLVHIGEAIVATTHVGLRQAQYGQTGFVVAPNRVPATPAVTIIFTLALLATPVVAALFVASAAQTRRWAQAEMDTARRALASTTSVST